MKKNRNYFSFSEVVNVLSEAMEKIYMYVGKLGEDSKFYSFIINLFKAVFFLLSAFSFLLSIVSIVYFYYFRNYPREPLLTLSPIENKLFMWGMFSILYSFIFIIIAFLGLLGRISRFIKKTIVEKIYQPLVKFVNSLIDLFLGSKFITFLKKAGRKLGFIFIVYPALSYLEPDIDRRSVSMETVEQLPPQAFSDKDYCKTTFEKYQNFSGLPLMVYFSVVMLVFFVLLSPILWFVNLFVELLPPIYFEALISTVTIFCFASFFVIMYESRSLYLKRYFAWVDCLYQNEKKEYLENETRKIEVDVDKKLKVDIEKLTALYKNEYQKTQATIRERDLVIAKLQHLADEAGIDLKAKQDIIYIVEYVLGQKQKEDIVGEKTKFNRDLIINISIAFVFYVLGKL